MQVLEIQSKELNDNQENLAGIKINSAFRKLSKNTICFHVWKIEEDRLEAIPKTQYGTFYEDCTYIIYAACNIGGHVTQDTITRAIKSTSNLQRFIHFWLGEKTTPPKSGNVAFKVMELDNYFDNVAVQYRETQGNESTRFLSYFINGVIVLASSLIDVRPECRLFQITGRQWPICTEKKSISWHHFNSDYIMVLKSPAVLFVWLGRSSSAGEKRNALSMTERMSSLYNVSEITVVDDGYEQSMSKLDKEEWNFYLPLKDRFVTQTAAIEKPTMAPLKLYKCGYNAGKYRVEELKTTAPEQSDLNNSESTFIIDAFLLGVWIWIGKLTARQEKMEAMRNARGFVKKKKYPYSTPVIRVIEGYEPAEFTRLFPTWKSCSSSTNNISKMLGNLESLILLQRPKMAAETQLIDDGTGEKHLFRITNGQREENDFIFFSSDSYILQYIITFSDGNHVQNNQTKCSNVIYFWAGKDVSPEVRSECEILAENYFENLPKNSVMIKISEGFETPHFLQIFGGKFVVFKGQDTKGNNNPQVPLKFVLKVIGDSTFNAKAIQTDPLTVTTSKDCYVVKSSDIWVWCGQCSTGDAREAAKKIGALMGEYTLVMETKETDEFWDNVSDVFYPAKLNGFHENGISYPDIDAASTSAAGLYLCYLKHDNIETKEIVVFNQSDLAPEEIYLLDAGNIIFIWVGEHSSPEESRSSWVMAKQFVNTYPVQRNQNCAIALVRQGYEPNIFTGFFENWDEKYLNNHLSYEKMRKSLEKNPASHLLPVGKHETEFDKYTKYPLSILQQEADLLPSGISITKKEIHLTHDDFFEIFRMNYCEFENLPSWKKQELKKRHKLF